MQQDLQRNPKRRVVARDQQLAPAAGRHALFVATAALVILWILVVLLTPWIRFVIFTPRAKTGFDVTLSLLGLFVALILVLFPDDADRDRLRWLALGFVILGAGGLVFGFVLPLIGQHDDIERAMYCSLAVRTGALVAMAIGMATSRPPQLSRPNLVLATGAAVLLATAAMLSSASLPDLANVDDLEAVARQSDATLQGLTTTHWILSAIPLGLALTAAVGLIRHPLAFNGRDWLTVAMILMAGSQFHTMFWPSAYSPVLTSASFLRLAFTLVVVVSAVFALRGVADERASVLAAERQLGARMAELATLRADFTAMVAHELASPAAALQGYSAMLATGALDREQQILAGEAVRAEAELIATLIGDVRASALAERDDFQLRVEPVAVAELLNDVAEFGRSLPGEHPVQLSPAMGTKVAADPERIAQVLRNLVANACKHTPAGTRVALRSFERDGCVRIEVADEGPGIHPDDLSRIFEKFGRGRDAVGDRVAGVGLGLYLSRRIIQAHGGRLGVESTPGKGAKFWLDLPSEPGSRPGADARHRTGVGNY